MVVPGSSRQSLLYDFLCTILISATSEAGRGFPMATDSTGPGLCHSPPMDKFVQLDLSKGQGRTRSDVQAAIDGLSARARELRALIDDGNATRDLKFELDRVEAALSAERSTLHLMEKDDPI